MHYLHSDAAASLPILLPLLLPSPGSELHSDGIDTTHVIRAAGHPSPFTYIIVDRQGG